VRLSSQAAATEPQHRRRQHTGSRTNEKRVAHLQRIRGNAKQSFACRSHLNQRLKRAMFTTKEVDANAESAQVAARRCRVRRPQAGPATSMTIPGGQSSRAAGAGCHWKRSASARMEPNQSRDRTEEHSSRRDQNRESDRRPSLPGSCQGHLRRATARLQTNRSSRCQLVHPHKKRRAPRSRDYSRPGRTARTRDSATATAPNGKVFSSPCCVVNCSDFSLAARLFLEQEDQHRYEQSGKPSK